METIVSFSTVSREIEEAAVDYEQINRINDDGESLGAEEGDLAGQGKGVQTGFITRDGVHRWLSSFIVV